MLASRFAAGVGLALIASACGSSSDSAAIQDSVPDVAETLTGGTVEAVTVASDGDAGSAPESPADGRYQVGDTYTDGEFNAVYLGLAEIPLGPDIWPDGACYAPLFEVTYTDAFGLGPNSFSPAVDGYLTDGRIADDDNTGVGCDTKVFVDAGYVRGVDSILDKDESAKVYGTPFRVAAADAGLLDIVTLYGGGPESGLVPDVALILTS